MQNYRDYYAILGIDQGTPPEEIKRAYRKQARKYHPDLNPGDKAAEEQFKAIGEAYEVLSDQGKRSQYDQYSRFWRQKNLGRKGSKTTRNGSRDFNQYPDFNTFVDDLLRQKSTPRPTSSRYETNRQRVETSDPYRPGTTKTTYTVGASGRDTAPSRARPRDVEAKLTLPLEKAYKGGRERIRLEDGRSLEVEMPTAMLDGQRVRLRNQGIDGGDLYLKISIAPHPFLELQGADIYCQLPLTPSEAVLGGPVEVPTLDGLVKMTVPNGVRSGQRLRLANKGYPLKEGRGDQLVEIRVVIPQEITPQEQELYEKLRSIETFHPRRHFFREL